MVSESGFDARAFEKLVAKAQQMRELKPRLQRALAAEALSLVGLGFHQGTDPYGKAWEPLALREGRPLRDTGRLGTSFATEIVPEGFRIGTKVKYAPTHQYGATITPKKAKTLRFAVGRGKGKRWYFSKKVVIPARPMLPRSGELGPVWTQAFHRVLSREFARIRAAL